MKLFNVYRDGKYVGSIRASSAAQAVISYAAWVHQSAASYTAKRAKP